MQRTRVDAALSALAALAADARRAAIRQAEYLHRNARGARVDRTTWVDREADLEVGVVLSDHSRIRGASSVGAFTYATRTVIEHANVGRLCSLGPGTLIGPEDHPLDAATTHPLTYAAGVNRAAPVIGAGVWTGANV